MTSPAAPSVKVWDPLVRIGHWTMVTSVAIAWLVTEGKIHEVAGYVLLGLMTLRIVWGFVGPQHARFANFVTTPTTALAYARQVLAGREPRHLGHNPLGGWMIVALLVTGVATALSGWAYTTDTYWGVEWVEDVHEFLAYLMLALIALHVGGVVLTSHRHRENLVAAMLHGRKRPLEADNGEGKN